MSALNQSRRHALAACIAAAFALTAFAPLCSAAYDNVLNCNDTGPGSLRVTIASAGNGDTVVLNPVAMQCSTVTLNSGEIVVPQNDLTVKYNGNNANQFVISGYYRPPNNLHGRVLNHTGTGKLVLQRLDIAYGRYREGFVSDETVSISGGCVRSAGVVDLETSTVSGCTLHGETDRNHFARGGGVYARGGLILNRSIVTGNKATNKLGKGNLYHAGPAQGGGLFTNGYVQAQYSTIAGNTAYSYYSGNSSYYSGSSSGGGIFVSSGTSTPSFIRQSTISGNYARSCSGIFSVDYNNTLTIQNSTISGNGFPGDPKYTQPPAAPGAALCASGRMTILNSTIANNFGASPSSAIYLIEPTSVGIFSSIVADNNLGGGYDIKSKSGITLSGAYNLIQSHSTTVSFSFAPSNADPMLQPLANNGGSTQTQAFPMGSPAFGSGSNLAGNFSTDQRGSGFVRTVNGATDIGAYEQQIRDRIFASGFD